MLLRAMLVMLVLLNAGVAAWWLARPPMPAAPAPVAPRGVPLLELVTAAPASNSASAGPTACFRYGPFRNPDAFASARAAIASEVLWTATGRAFDTPPRAWRVVLPQATREQASATAARIGAAGFADYLVLPATGADANAIALGRYGNEAAARERARALAAAGFPALAEPVGGREVLWLDVAAPATFAAASATLGLTGIAIPCTGVVRDGRYTVDTPA